MPRKRAKQIPPSEKEFDYSKFGKTVQDLIYAKGYTISSVASAINLSGAYFEEQLHGKKRMQLHTYVKLIDVLKASDIILLSDILSAKEISDRSHMIHQVLSIIRKIPEDKFQEFLDDASRYAEDE